MGVRTLVTHRAAPRLIRRLPRPVRRRVVRAVTMGQLPPHGDQDQAAIIMHARSHAATTTWTSAMLGCLAVLIGALLAASESLRMGQRAFMAATAGCRASPHLLPLVCAAGPCAS